jgi:transposase
MLPQEMSCGSGMSCWRRLRDWQEAGIWQLIHFSLLDWLARYGQIEWSRAVVDSCSVRAVFGGAQTGPNPTDRAKLGSKRHLICDGRGVPLAIQLTGANRNDSLQALALVDAIPSLQGDRGRPRHRPKRIRSAMSFGTTKLEVDAGSGEVASVSTAKRKKAITNDGSGVFLRGFFNEVPHSKDSGRRASTAFRTRAAAVRPQ